MEQNIEGNWEDTVRPVVYIDIFNDKDTQTDTKRFATIIK
jgi:hypothetical protein